TTSGARLHCAFQRLDAEIKSDGLWLTSTVADQTNECFRVKPVALSRVAKMRDPAEGPLGFVVPLSALGDVGVDGKTVRISRGGLVEEDSVSVDGVRQDFLLPERPAGTGELRVLLEVAGAKVQAMADGACFVVGKSGRRIAYSRLRVIDAVGRELPARVE